VDVLDLYETVAEPLPAEAIAAVQTADYVTFTSSSTVRFLREAIGEEGAPAKGGPEAARSEASRAGLSPQTRIVSIGPLTSQTLREHGFAVEIEASEHDVEGIVRALLADAATRQR
jgi:uroporphyrinogen III methyltransferase/synthase